MSHSPKQTLKYKAKNILLLKLHQNQRITTSILIQTLVNLTQVIESNQTWLNIGAKPTKSMILINRNFQLISFLVQ